MYMYLVILKPQMSERISNKCKDSDKKINQDL